MNIDSLLQLVDKSSRYSGSEFNAVRKEWSGAEARFALIFPDLYEIGMSHQGLQILYHIINGKEELLAERAYAPDLDMEKLLRRQGQPLFSLESHRPLHEFDVLGITLPYELCYTNILTILKLAGLPLRSAHRRDALPLVIGGGPCGFHPEPVADFFDAILLGDGEEAILDIAELIKTAKREGLGREELLRRLSEIEGVYVPAFFTPRYDGQGRLLAVEPLRPGYEKVRRRILPDLDAAGSQSSPLVPHAKIVHDRLAVEIARGCTRGCRFCQAGIIYRPVRERSPQRVLELAAEGIARSGFEEMALLSLSTGDYACLPEVLLALMDRFADQRVSVSMPSMRVGTLTPEIMAQIKRVRKTGFTMAPEAGTDRLRQVINKGITEADLLASCRSAFELGWQQMKLYFMFGLPTETAADLQAIPELAAKVLQTAPRGRGQVNVSAATFVPKPHTVFEREPQLSMAEGFAHLDFLKKRLGGKRFNLKWHDPRLSFLEGVLSRGDRRLSALVEEAWRQGARLDAWTEHFDLEIWRQAALSCGLDLDHYLARRGPQEILPWQHLDTGVEAAFLEAELAKAMEGAYTPDCRVNGCQQCGLCDFKTIKPVVHQPRAQAAATTGEARKETPVNGGGRFSYQLIYSRLDKARFLSHLEVMRMFYRAFRRLGMPLGFSEGFNPTPRVSFGPALPVGTESREEFLVMELTEPLAEPRAARELLNRQLPEGFEVLRLEMAARETEGATLTCYHINLSRDVTELALADFRQKDNFAVTIERKGKKRYLDVRPLVEDLAVIEDGTIQLHLASEPGKAGVKPLELLAAVLGLSEEETRLARVMKVWSRKHDLDLFTDKIQRTEQDNNVN
jgi:radical SAM family uncharacterized protein/radical SAM-linked protein